MDPVRLKHLTEMIVPPKVVSARQRFAFVQRLAAAKKAGAPLEGIYWWVPVPSPLANKTHEWDLMEFYDNPEKGVAYDHAHAWRFVAQRISDMWGKPASQIQNLPYALPRGRVNVIVGEKGRRFPVLFHGDDTPLGESLRPVRRLFNLTSRTPTMVDDHSSTATGQPAQLQNLLGFKMGLTTDMWDEFEDDEEEDDYSLEDELKRFREKSAKKN
jgi:hypothetical protein